MRAPLDLAGGVYGRLTVLERVENDPSGKTRWLVMCSCGRTKTVRGSHLKSGEIVSCGCHAREAIVRRSTKHGDAKTGDLHPLYDTWHAMKRRCLNPGAEQYRWYGGRGIRVCDEWQSWPAFRDYITGHLGPRPTGMTLDRIDNDGNYEPGNVRWATALEQTQNRGGRADSVNPAVA